jgi:hypothetical protein
MFIIHSLQIFIRKMENKGIKLSDQQILEAFGLRDIEAPTFSRQSADRRMPGQPYAPAAFYHPGRFLLLISVTA